MLLILREEMICVIILSFLIFYYAINKVKDKEMLFLKLACFALLHIIFDIATVITVNQRELVPDSVNRLLHICFYLSGILFIMAFYHYVIHISPIYRHEQLLKNIGCVPLLVFIVLLIFLPMEYVEGNGTDYSFGPLAIVGYALFVGYCAVCMGILLVYRRELDQRVKRSLIPMIIVMFTTVVLQALIPELLMTGAGVTFVCIGMFVALDNPDKDFMEQALWDFLTGLKNRNCYKRDLEKYILRFQNRTSGKRIGFVVADLNLLKTVNDTYGHAEGDKLIAGAAEVLRSSLKSAENVYRLGGDEFIAIYLSPKDETAAAEMEQVRMVCEKADGFAVPLSIAMGYASGIIDENAQAIVDQADQQMYENKLKMKAEGKIQSIR